MENKTYNLEHQIKKMFQEKSNLGVDSGVVELTKELIKEGENVRKAMYYAHTVCHLFERYNIGRSFLNSPQLFPLAEELVNYTLNKSLSARDFGCLDRIIRPIMELNITHLEENPDGFIFKPDILTNPDFIREFSLSKEVKYDPYLADFCKASSIGEFFPVYVENLIKEKKLERETNFNEVTPGVFIDVVGTFIEYDHYDEEKKKSVYKKCELIEEYALRKLEQGIPVTIFTSGDLEEYTEKLRQFGVDERLLDLKSKSDYVGKTLEVCVDDTAPSIQGFRAKTYYSSGKVAWDTEYSDGGKNDRKNKIQNSK